MSRKIFFGLLIVAIILIFIVGCSQSQESQSAPIEESMQGQPSQEQQQTQNQTEQEQSVSKFTREEIAKHNSKEDCWLLLNGKVYDVTDMIGSHPGGNAILEGCGKEASHLFETRPMGSGTPHSEKARNNLAKFYIGDFQG